MGFSEVLGKRLLQGSFPVPRTPIRHVADVLVLSAIEVQPASSNYPDVEVLHCPLDDRDAPPSREEVVRALQCANVITRYLSSGKRVLVTCYQGRNRSGLLTALTLENLGFSASGAIRRVRAARRNALTNKYFVELLHAHAAQIHAQPFRKSA